MMLLNPRRRRKARKSTASKSAPRRSTRIRRRTTARRRPAMRRRRSGSRRSSRTVARRRSGGGGSALKGYRIGKLRVLTNPRRFRGLGGGGGGLIPGINFLSKDDVMLGVGAVAGSLLSQTIQVKYGSKLPLLKDNPNSVPGKILYSLGIPLAAAVLVSKVSRPVAKGIALGGIIDTIGILVSSFAPSVTAGLSSTGEYLNYTPNPTGALPPGYSAVNTLQNIRPVNGAFDSPSAFAPDAWSGGM